MRVFSEIQLPSGIVEQKQLGVPCVHRPSSGEDLTETAAQRFYRLCIHESAHAVFALYLGYVLGPSGVWVNEEGFGRCDCEGITNPHHEAHVKIAGILAEWEWWEPGSQLGGTSFASAHHAHHLLINAKRGPRSDAAQVMRLAAQLLPEDPDRLMTLWIMDGRGILRDRGVWNAIIATANSLYASGTLGDHEVQAIIEAILSLETRTHVSLPESGLAVGLRASSQCAEIDNIIGSDMVISSRPSLGRLK